MPMSLKLRNHSSRLRMEWIIRNLLIGKVGWSTTLTSKPLIADVNTISNLETDNSTGVIDTDGTLTANSDTKLELRKHQNLCGSRLPVDQKYGGNITGCVYPSIASGVHGCGADLMSWL